MLLSVYFLSAITQTKNQLTYYLNDIQAAGLHIVQYRNIYNPAITMNYSNINYENYLHRGPYTQCGKMTHKENLDQS